MNGTYSKRAIELKINHPKILFKITHRIKLSDEEKQILKFIIK